MKFTDAIKKYGTICNDNGVSGIFYIVVDNNKIVRFNCNDEDDSKIIEDVFEIADLMMSEDWGSVYEEVNFRLPKRYENYYFINTTNEVHEDIDSYSLIDNELYRIFNYFPNEEMARYIADSQLIYRIVLTLEVLNRNMEEFKRREYIDEFLENNYGDVLDRISEYERKNNL